MKTKPILFQGDMVRAILDGRKTQTRRIVKHQPPTDEFGAPACGEILGPEMYEPAVIDRHGEMVPGEPVYGAYDADGEWGAKCPYGQPGDLLWVREAFRLFDAVDECGCSDAPCPCPATGSPLYRASGDDPDSTWKPSIHMPRWASRLTLEITDVRVERVRDISRGDAMEEGCPFPNMAEADPVGWFANLWQSINGQDSWDANPWVWVVEFRAIHANVDEVLAERGAA